MEAIVETVAPSTGGIKTDQGWVNPVDKNVHTQCSKGDKLIYELNDKKKAVNIQIVKESLNPPVTPEEKIGETPKDPVTVSDFKSKEADKFELGMAKNAAIQLLSTQDYLPDRQLLGYDDLVKSIYEKGRKIRKELLGY